MKTRVVHTKIWQDQWFVKLSRAGKYLFLYLLTCPEINLTGIFELSNEVICFHTKLKPSELELSKEELKDKAIFHQGYIQIINVDKYSKYTGELNEKAKKKELDSVPKEVLRGIEGVSKGYRRGRGYRRGMHSLSNKKSVISNKKSKTRNQKQEIKNKKSVRGIGVLRKKVTELGIKKSAPLSQHG